MHTLDRQRAAALMDIARRLSDRNLAAEIEAIAAAMSPAPAPRRARVETFQVAGRRVIVQRKRCGFALA